MPRKSSSPAWRCGPFPIQPTCHDLNVSPQDSSEILFVGVRLDVMKTTYLVSPLVAFVCVAIALLLAVTQPVLVLGFAFLIPFLFFVADVLDAPVPCARKVRRALPLLALPVFSPRPPPAE
jgi:hypothetical protein